MRGDPDALIQFVDDVNRGREPRPIEVVQEKPPIEQQNETQEQPEEEIPEELVEEDVACGHQASLSSYF